MWRQHRRAWSAFLAGVAESRHQLDLAAPVDRYLGTGWSKADRSAESAITVRHLVTMTSGLNDSLTYLQHAGDTWRYNTGAYSRMIGVIEKAVGTDIQAFTRDVLTGPTGMTDSRWLPRPWSAGNDAANSIGLATTGRDLARFGLLILARGKWDGNDLLQNPSYLRQMLTPIPGPQSLLRTAVVVEWPVAISIGWCDDQPTGLVDSLRATRSRRGSGRTRSQVLHRSESWIGRDEARRSDRRSLQQRILEVVDEGGSLDEAATAELTVAIYMKFIHECPESAGHYDSVDSTDARASSACRPRPAESPSPRRTPR